MILKFQSLDGDVKRIIGLLCDAFGRAAWIVFQPSFINFGSDADYDARLIQISSGEVAFRLASAELCSLVATDSIGFDWTDLEMIDVEGNRRLVYLQCVDAIQWYAKPYVAGIDRMLKDFGFEQVGEEVVPRI